MGRRRRARVASALLTRGRDRHSVKNIADLTGIGLGAVQSIFDRFERHGWLTDHLSSTHLGLLMHSYEITDTGRDALVRLAGERGLPTR
jgi:DNA-binding PadR family transcriptional regulator